MIVNVNALPEKEIDYWGSLALLKQLIDEEKTLNNFLTEQEAQRIYSLNDPVLVEYQEGDDDEILDTDKNDNIIIEKSFKTKFFEKINKIARGN